MEFSKFQFFLDGILVQDPKNWVDLDTTLKKDFFLQGILTSQESELEFYGNGYDYIKSVSVAEHFCSYIVVKIKQTCDGGITYDTIFNGIIFIADCTFDLMRCSVKAKTVDDGFYARINNNKNIKVKIDLITQSKNGLPITPATPVVVDLFDPATGLYGGNTPEMYTVYEAFKFLIAYISDDEVDFVSTDFAPGGQWEGVVITVGNEIRLFDHVIIPEISFQDLFTEINKKFRIGFNMVRIAGRPTIVIDHYESFFESGVSLTLPDAYGVIMKYKKEFLYTQVHLGAATTEIAGSYDKENNLITGWKDANAPLVGVCNVDNTLDLNSTWQITSNVIEDVYIGDNSDYDEDIFIIEADINTNQAVSTLDILTYHYNEMLVNREVLLRWSRGLPNNPDIFTNAGDNVFIALRTSNSTSYNAAPNGVKEFPVKFENDYNSPAKDVNNNYGNGTIQGNPVAQANSRYTAPLAGSYTFRALLKAYIETIILQTAAPAVITFYFKHFNSFNVLQSTFSTNQTVFNTDDSTVLNIVLSQSFTMAIGDYMVCGVDTFLEPNDKMRFRVYAGSYFLCEKAPDSTITKIVDENLFKIKEYNFTYPITYAQLQTIKANTKEKITFTTNNNQVATGWIDEIKYYHHDKVANVKLISN